MLKDESSMLTKFSFSDHLIHIKLRSSEILNYLSALRRPDCTLSNLSRDHRPMTQSIAIAVTEEALPLIHTLTSAATDGLFQLGFMLPIVNR